MLECSCDVAVVGSGPAGLAAAAAARKAGAGRVLIIERDVSSGGILQQCIHAGFGLKYFSKELTGPEYAEIFYKRASSAGAEWLFATTALEIRGRTLVCVGKQGMLQIRFGALVLAMGCRERTRGNLVIPGSRPAGIYTAGTAQRLMNIYGYHVGKEVVILGSGDIGLIMARRLTLEGAHVKAVVEYLPYLAGLERNMVQCLEDFRIPLLLSHTVVDISGISRVESVTIAPVDIDKKPILPKSKTISCDTLLLSVGLIPENELSRTAGVELCDKTQGARVNQYMQTNQPGIFACGNVLHVNDLADNVSLESEKAGKYAALYAADSLPSGREVPVCAGAGIRHVCPQRILPGTDGCVSIFLRTSEPGCDVRLFASSGGRELVSRQLKESNPGTMEELLLSEEQVNALTEPVVVRAVRLGEKR